jgi:small subunit ribosomal protein S21
LIRVKVRMNESLDQLLKRFKKACEKEGLTRDIKRTAFYEKPSEKRRRQERQLIRKMQKEPAGSAKPRRRSPQDP